MLSVFGGIKFMLMIKFSESMSSTQKSFQSGDLFSVAVEYGWAPSVDSGFWGPDAYTI